jgi:hypothetical protein
MKKNILILAAVGVMSVLGAQIAITGFTELTEANAGDGTVFEVADPAATPKSRKYKLTNLVTKAEMESGTLTAGFSTLSAGTIIITNGSKYPISGSTAGLSSDDTYSGLPIIGMNAGETVAQWDLVRVHSDGEWHLADADAAGEQEAVAIAAAAGTDGNAMTVLTKGTVRNDAWNWTIGGALYLSATAGGLTQTAPSTATHVVQKVGRALTADIIWFDPDSTTLVAQ